MTFRGSHGGHLASMYHVVSCLDLQSLETIFTSIFKIFFLSLFKAHSIMNEEGGLSWWRGRGGGCSQNVFLLAGNWCNEPKRVPIIPLAYTKRKERLSPSSFFSSFLSPRFSSSSTSHALASIDCGEDGGTRSSLLICADVTM